MASSILDFTSGIAFSNKVLQHLGSPVISPFPDDAHSFWLIASFARCKIKIDETNVGLILQSILGGVASEFAVVEIQDWNLRFFLGMLALWSISLVLFQIPFSKSLSIFGMNVE